MHKALSLGIFLLISGFLVAQDVTPDSQKPRVFITDSQSWEIGGYSAGGSGGGGSMTRGGARPQTAEIIKTFGQRCPDVITNNIQTKADYIVLLDHEGGKSFVRHKNKVAVFARASGDSVISKSTLSLGGSVQEACDAINKDWAVHGAGMREAHETEMEAAAPRSAPARTTASAPPPISTPAPHSAPADPPAPATGKLSIVSIPDGADIEIEGSFVGNAPSDVQLTDGDYTVTIKKAGFKTWERKLKVTSGSNVHVQAELEKGDAQ
ncbi:MAG TPA: PEGA domain-containing protein [Candidatus Sulfotelmatobacter sp.]|nr:PEGA domain-containing protein [Candidatus Sulfotelmatobacter sp.]